MFWNCIGLGIVFRNGFDYLDWILFARWDLCFFLKSDLDLFFLNSRMDSYLFLFELGLGFVFIFALGFFFCSDLDLSLFPLWDIKLGFGLP